MKFIDLPVKHYTNFNEIKDVNNYLNDCSKKGLLRPVRRDKVAGGGENLIFSNYKDNAMYTMCLDKKGFIKKIVKW